MPYFTTMRERITHELGSTVCAMAVLLGTMFASTPGLASDLNPLTITIVESGEGRYFEPAGRRIVIRSQPIRLFIRIRNTTEAAIGTQDVTSNISVVQREPPPLLAEVSKRSPATTM